MRGVAHILEDNLQLGRLFAKLGDRFIQSFLEHGAKQLNMLAVTKLGGPLQNQYSFRSTHHR